MRNVDVQNVTDAVNARLSNCANPRLKAIMAGLTSHLHDFVREVGLTEAEWLEGIEFLTATGHMCDDQRQEFIMLSDVLGVSMLTVALNNSKPPGATDATVLGPFHLENTPSFDNGADIANGAVGIPCFMSGQVRGLNGEAIAHAQFDVWHADQAGFYDTQYAGGALRARARLQTDADGRFQFRTIKPVAYPIPSDGPVGKMLTAVGRHPWRPAHAHFMLQASGYETLVTHVFENGDPYLDSDPVFGVRSSLIADFVLREAGIEHNGEMMDQPFYTVDLCFVLNPVGGAKT